MKILVIVNSNLIQGFRLNLKIPFLVKTKVKVGQMNWWTKLTNNIIIDLLYTDLSSLAQIAWVSRIQDQTHAHTQQR